MWPSAAASKHHGLVNQGATCYLNSVLQVLFMTEDFREAVDRHTYDHPATECIDLQLTSLFDDLKRRRAYTYNITKKLGIVRVSEQCDAAEYFEKILCLTSSDASQIFHGKLTHKTKCSVCCTETDADGAFWHLPLALVDSYSEHYSVVNGIEEYFRASDFKGEDQMYCDECDAKCDATIQCVIKHHPDVLTLLLKRFEFDYQDMTYVKINHTVDVPCTLQIPQNQTYEVYAVVEHFGNLTSGHYAAKIKSQDDGRWYDFNDDRVTLLNYQPFQVDNFEKSSSAYLLFYRKKKVHAADTCTQDIREASAPATGYICDWSQDAVKMRERQEVERAAEAEYQPAVAVSLRRNEETGVKDVVRSGGEGLPSDVEDEANGVYAGQSVLNNHRECNEERNHSLYYLQDAHVEKQRGEGYKGGNAGRDVHNASYDDQKFTQEVSSVHARRDYPQQVCVDVQRGEEGMGMDVNRDAEGKTEGNEQPERRVIASTKYLDGKAEREGLHEVRENPYGDQEGAQEVGQNYDLKPPSADEREDRMEIDVKRDKERQTGAEERGEASGRENPSTKHDLCYDKTREKASDQRREHGSRYKSHEQQREDERDVEREEKRRRDDKHAQMKGTSERQQSDQNNGRLDDVRQEDVGAVKQAKEREKRGDNERRADSSRWREGLARSRRQGDSSPRIGYNEGVAEGRQGSNGSRTFYGMIVEEEFRDGVQSCRETTNIRIETVGTSRDSIKSWVEYDEGKSDPKTDAKVTLSEGVYNLKLNDLPKEQTRRTQRMSDDEQEQAARKFAKKKGGKKSRKPGRGSSPPKKIAKEKKKRKKTTGCLAFFWKKRKNADRTSESD